MSNVNSEKEKLKAKIRELNIYKEQHADVDELQNKLIIKDKKIDELTKRINIETDNTAKLFKDLTIEQDRKKALGNKISTLAEIIDHENKVFIL